VIFDQADEDNDKMLSVEEFKTFLTIEMENNSETDLLEVLENELVVTSFDWIDSATKDGVLDWGEVWSHIGTSGGSSGSQFLIDDPWGTEFLKEEEKMAAPTKRFRSGQKIGLMSKLEELSGVGSKDDLKDMIADSKT
jgi:hypothetical protein